MGWYIEPRPLRLGVAGAHEAAGITYLPAKRLEIHWGGGGWCLTLRVGRWGPSSRELT